MWMSLIVKPGKAWPCNASLERSILPQVSTQEISLTKQGLGVPPAGGGVMGQHPHVVEDGPTDDGPSNRNVIDWAGAGYCPAPLSSHFGGVHEAMTRAANGLLVILEEDNVSNEELVTA